MSLGLAQGNAAAEHRPFAVGGDSDGSEPGTGHDGPAVADLFVPGVEDQVGNLAEGTVPPGGQLLVEFRGSPAHLCGGDLEAAELLDDLRDLPGADALAVHLGDRQDHGPFAAHAPLEALGIEGPTFVVVVVAALWDAQPHLADRGTNRLAHELGSMEKRVANSVLIKLNQIGTVTETIDAIRLTQQAG